MVTAEVADSFREWLENHIKEMIQLPGFLGAVLKSMEDLDNGSKQWTVAYRLENRAAMNEYLNVHAAAMRSDGMKLFEGKFTASRRIFDICMEYTRQ